MLDIHQIFCFVSTYKAGSISRAAEEAFLTQQAVSHNLRELEKKLGGPLFQRSANGVAPTELGNALYEDARKLLLDCDALEKRAKLLTRGYLGLTLAFANGIFSVPDAPALNDLSAMAQDKLGLPLRLMELTMGECLQMLDSGEADMICVFNPAPKTGLHIRVLKDYPLYGGMAPGHPLAEKETVTPEDIIPYGVICDRRDQALNGIMEGLTTAKEQTPLRYAPSSQLSSFADFMRRDGSLLIFTKPFLQTYAGADAIIRPYDRPDAHLQLSIVYRAGHPEWQKLIRIADWLKSHYDRQA